MGGSRQTGNVSPAQLEKLLGVSVGDIAVYRCALTHSSVATGVAPGGANYQRLEFLGDRVLSLAICDDLYRRFPRENEGTLALRLVDLVRRERCAEVARNLGLATMISYGDRALGAAIPGSVLADVVEALLGAIHVDRGYAPAQAAALRWWNSAIVGSRDPAKDYKTQLQEWAQARGLPLPVYRLGDREGPDHAPRFRMDVWIDGYRTCTGRDDSKRAAEQAAAREFLSQISIGEAAE